MTLVMSLAVRDCAEPQFPAGKAGLTRPTNQAEDAEGIKSTLAIIGESHVGIDIPSVWLNTPE